MTIRALMVDDDLAVCDAVKLFAHEHGIEIETLQFNVEAWHEYSSNPTIWDCLILDNVSDPGMRTAELIEKVRNVDGFVGIVAYSGNSRESENYKGVHFVVDKSEPIGNLIESIRESTNMKNDREDISQMTIDLTAIDRSCSRIIAILAVI